MEVTRAMADGLPALIPADIYVAVTGLTTPGGSETAEKPVGTMFVYASVRGKPASFRKVFKGSCEAIIRQTIRETAHLLVSALKNFP